MAIEDEQGIYRLDDAPGKPHPHCYCYLTAADLPTLEELEQALADGKFDTPDNKFSEDPNFNTRLRPPSEMFNPTFKSNPEDWDGDLDGMRQILKESVSATDSLRKILSDRGWTEGATVFDKSDFEKLDSSAEIWRGLKNSNSTTTEQMMDDFARGKDPFIGVGIYGNGWYFAKSKDVAGMYAGWDGRVYRSKISKDANMFEILDDEVDIFSLPGFAWTRDQKYSGTAIQTDPSVAAAMMGYDGFIIHERGPSRTNIFYNLWNRSMIYLEDWT